MQNFWRGKKNHNQQKKLNSLIRTFLPAACLDGLYPISSKYKSDGNLTYNKDKNLVIESRETKVNSNFSVRYSNSASVLNFSLSNFVSFHWHKIEQRIFTLNQIVSHHLKCDGSHGHPFSKVRQFWTRNENIPHLRCYWQLCKEIQNLLPPPETRETNRHLCRA